MYDPKPPKEKTEIWLEAKYHIKGKEVPIRLYVRKNKEDVVGLSDVQIKKMLEDDLQYVSPSPVSAINNTHARFQYVDPADLKSFDFGNTLVEAHLPYCIHLPNEYELEVFMPEENIKAWVIFKKIWTDRADDNGFKSSEADFYAEDRVLYFKNGSIIGPKMPVRPQEGWEQKYTGRNIEKIKGQNGVFRYTSLYIQFDFEPDLKELETVKCKEELDKVADIALKVINRLIDAYRLITDQEHVQRLGVPTINLIYFVAHNLGYYISALDIETARMNRSKQEIDKIKNMLEKGQKPDLYNLLLLDARSSLNNKDFSLSVIQSFQALEIFLESFLYSELKKRGDSNADISCYLDQHWRTKERLKECLKEIKNTTLYDSDHSLWNKWCLLTDKVRDEIVHNGKEPNQKEVVDVLLTNLSIIRWLKTI